MKKINTLILSDIEDLKIVAILYFRFSCSQRLLKYLAFQYFGLFQKCSVCT